MKKFLSLIALAMTLGFTSCSEVECDHGRGDNTGELVGTWYEEVENEEVTYSESGSFYDKYSNVRRASETEGRYELDRKNMKLTEYFTYLGQSVANDLKIRELSDLSFTVYSDKIGSHTFGKVIETINLAVGESKIIDVPSILPCVVKDYTSLNDNIASVTSDGMVNAEGEKGTAYIKISTDKQDIWAKVVVGDNIADLWYPFNNLIGMEYRDVKNIMGEPDQSNDKTLLYNTIFSDISDRLWIYLEDGCVSQIQMELKNGFSKTALLSYLKTRYYEYSENGDLFVYTTRQNIRDSRAVVAYQESTNSLFFDDVNNGWILNIPDFKSCFGLNIEELKKIYGEPLNSTMWELDNSFFQFVKFNIHPVKSFVNAYTLSVASNVDKNDLLEALSEEFYLLKDNGVLYAFYNAPERENATIYVAYNTSTNQITYFDLINFYSDLWPDYTTSFGKTSSELVDIYGEPISSTFWMIDNNQYATFVSFHINDNSSKVDAYHILLTEEATKEKVIDYLSKKYYLYKEQDGKYAFCETEKREDAQVIQIVFDSVNGYVTYYDLPAWSSYEQRSAIRDDNMMQITHNLKEKAKNLGLLFNQNK